LKLEHPDIPDWRPIGYFSQRRRRLLRPSPCQSRYTAYSNSLQRPHWSFGLQPEIDAWLAAKQLPARPDEINKKGTAQVWTLARADGASLAIVSAKDAASLEALIRLLPHYRRQSYITFDGRKAVEKGIWPVQVQTVVVE